MKIGERIVKLRESKGWSQRELAQRSGLNNSVMNRIETGDRPLKDHEVSIFADIFDVTTDYLLGRTEQKEVSNDDIKYEEYMNDPDFQHAMRSANGFSKENKARVLDLIKMLEELEEGRKPGDRQPRNARNRRK